MKVQVEQSSETLNCMECGRSIHPGEWVFSVEGSDGKSDPYGMIFCSSDHLRMCFAAYALERISDDNDCTDVEECKFVASETLEIYWPRR